MSLRVLTQGGAGGASASIFVTGLNEADTVTATKNGKVIAGKWEERHSLGELLPRIPAMTSNTAPYGVVSAYRDYSGPLSNPPQHFYAFDGDISRNYATCYPYSPGNDYIQYQFQDTVRIDVIKAYLLNDRAFKYTFLLSEDGDKWDEVCSFSRDTVDTTTPKWFSYELPEPARVKYIRCRIDQWTDISGNPAQVCEIQAYGYEEITVGGFLIEKIGKYGMWTVTATKGEETVVQEVLVDAAIEYGVEVYFSINTTFQERDPKWVESGGTFDYGNGLYSAYGSALGTILYVGRMEKHLDIPCKFKTFDLTATINIYTSDNGASGGCHIRLLDEAGNQILDMAHEDYWGDSKNQGANLFDSSQNVLAVGLTFANGSGYNGADVTWRLVYDGSNLSYYRNGSLVWASAITLSNVETIRVAFNGYTGAIAPQIILRSLIAKEVSQ